MMRTRQIGRMSWREAAEAFGTDPVVLLPMGTVEQHGPNLPMAADAVVAEHVALGAASRSNAVVVPTMPFGYCESSRSFPGTITLSAMTLSRCLSDAISSLVEHGARRFIVVNNHRSNEPIVQQVAREAMRDRRVIIGSFFPWGELISAQRNEYPGLSETIGHGGEPETSVLLHVCPDDVTPTQTEGRQTYTPFQGYNMPSAASVRVGDDLFALYVDLQHITATGVAGDGSAGSAERGAAILELTIAKLTRFIEFVGALDVDHA